MTTAMITGMSLAEKIGQMTQVEYSSITPDEVARLGIGSVLSGGGGNPDDGSAEAWRAHVAGYVEASRTSRTGIPILYASDAVHGHNNVRGATIFPHNIGLGATGDADLVRQVSRAAALETAATGVRWTFAPCLAVPQDPRWGRTYEGFGQDTGLVTRLGRAAVEGWHGDDPARDGVLACPKHYAGEGAMVWGTAGTRRHPWIEWWDGWSGHWQIDQGDITLDEADLRRDHISPFASAVDAGAMTVMACYASWHGERIHGHRYLLSDVLKGEIGFGGLVVSDWLAVDQLHDDYTTAVERAILAGVDVVMVPFDYARFIAALTELVETGRVPIQRIDDAVGRILRAKQLVGVLPTSPDPTGDAGRDAARDAPVALDLVGCDEHRRLARRAAAASTVVITDDGVLPLTGEVLAAGTALDDIGLACGGWSISWAGSAGPITPGRTMLDGLREHLGGAIHYDRTGHFADRSPAQRRAPVGVVTVHEEPYVEGGGDRADLSLPADQREVVQRMRDLVERLVVVVVSGRPVLVDELDADAIVAAWLPGSQADGVADVLVGVTPSTGRLPIDWPRHPSHIDGSTVPATAPAPWPAGHRAAATTTIRGVV